MVNTAEDAKKVLDILSRQEMINFYEIWSEKQNKRRYLKDVVGQIVDKYREQNPDKEIYKQGRKLIQRELNLIFTNNPPVAEGYKESSKEAIKIQSLNILLDEMFGGVIRLNRKKITADNFYNKIDEETVTINGVGKKYTEDTIKEKLDNQFNGGDLGQLTDESWEFLKENDDIKARIERIAEYVDEVKEAGLGTREASKELETVDISDRIKELLGWGRHWKVATRKSIYKGWEETSKKHKEVVESLRKLNDVILDKDIDKEMYSLFPDVKKPKTPSPKIEQASQKLTTAINNFEKSGNYVIEFKPQKVVETFDDELLVTRKIIVAFLENEMGLVPEVKESSSGGYRETEDDEEVQLEEYRPQQVSAIDGDLDLLAYFYTVNYMDEIFINDANLKSIKNMATETIKNHFGFESEGELKILKKYLDRLKQVKSIADSNFLPVYILEDSRIQSLYQQKEVNVSRINDKIEDLFDALLDLLQEERLVVGRSVTATRGFEFDPNKPNKDSVPSTYYAQFLSRPSKKRNFKENKRFRETFTDAMAKIVDYFYRPLFDPKKNLGIDYGFKESIAFKELLLLSETDFAKTYQKIYNGIVQSSGANIQRKDLKRIKDFFDIIERPNITGRLSKIEDRMKLLRTTFRGLVDGNKKLIENFEREMASFYGHLVKGIKSQSRKQIFGKSVVAMAKKMPIEDVSEMQSIMVLYDIFTDPNVRGVLEEFSETLNDIVKEIDSIKKMDIENKIMEIHDSVRILKGLPIYYGRGSLSSIDHLGEVIDLTKEKFNVDIVSTEIVKMVEEIDSFSSISKSVGVSEEVVYFVKANFR
jgi:hypothetical protein